MLLIYPIALFAERLFIHRYLASKVSVLVGYADRRSGRPFAADYFVTHPSYDRSEDSSSLSQEDSLSIPQGSFCTFCKEASYPMSRWGILNVPVEVFIAQVKMGRILSAKGKCSTKQRKFNSTISVDFDLIHE